MLSPFLFLEQGIFPRTYLLIVKWGREKRRSTLENISRQKNKESKQRQHSIPLQPITTSVCDSISSYGCRSYNTRLSFVNWPFRSSIQSMWLGREMHPEHDASVHVERIGSVVNLREEFFFFFFSVIWELGLLLVWPFGK